MSIFGRGVIKRRADLKLLDTFYEVLMRVNGTVTFI